MKTLQTIKSVHGYPEYVLLPIFVYEKLQHSIDMVLAKQNEDYVDFDPSNFIKNPIALRRMRAKLIQAELAKQLHVSQAYISKIERDDYEVTQVTLKKVYKAIDTLEKKHTTK
ncbi:MAG: helix-turn-helix transcriptional regulator [Gammaproteobacteria bacterium]|nr:helix-turn-helix transcriptional regulator [Gammaproteobacteria bacterium]